MRSVQDCSCELNSIPAERSDIYYIQRLRKGDILKTTSCSLSYHFNLANTGIDERKVKLRA